MAGDDNFFYEIAEYNSLILKDNAITNSTGTTLNHG